MRCVAISILAFGLFGGLSACGPTPSGSASLVTRLTWSTERGPAHVLRDAQSPLLGIVDKVRVTVSVDDNFHSEKEFDYEDGGGQVSQVPSNKSLDVLVEATKGATVLYEGRQEDFMLGPNESKEITIELQAVYQTDDIPPAEVDDLEVLIEGEAEDYRVIARWTVAGDDGFVGQASRVVLKRLSDPTPYGTRDDWFVSEPSQSWVIEQGNQELQPGGQVQHLDLGGHDQGWYHSLRFWVGLQTEDDGTDGSGTPNLSPVSQPVQVIVPRMMEGLIANPAGADSINLLWTSPGDTQQLGSPGASYVVLRWEGLVDDEGATLDSAQQVSDEPPDLITSGTRQGMTVTGLSVDQEYTFAVYVAAPDGTPLTFRSSLASAMAGGADTLGPNRIDWVQATEEPDNGGQIRLEWTNPGDDEDLGTVTGLEIKWSTANITDANFDEATSLPAPVPEGNVQNLFITEYDPATQYWFAIKAVDEAGNWSDMSMVYSLTTAAR